MGANELYYLSDKAAGYGRRTRARGMDPTSALLVEKGYPRFHKKENSCPLFAILPCSPAVITDSNLRGYGRGLLAPELLSKTWRSYVLR